MKKANKNILIGIAVAILILVSLYLIFGVKQEIFLFSSNQLTNYTNLECNVQQGNCEWTAQLNAPSNAENVTFFIAPSLSACTNSGISDLNIKYSAFNYQTNTYDKVYDRTFNVPAGDRSAYYVVNPEIHKSSTIILLTSEVVDSYWRTKYYACLPGMESQLPATVQGSKYGYYQKCVYPGESYTTSEGRIYEVPIQNFLDKRYINNNAVKFKIESTRVTSPCGPNFGNEFFLGGSTFGIKEVVQEQVIIPEIPVVETTSNGTTIETFENGTVIETAPDGTIVIKESKQSLPLILGGILIIAIIALAAFILKPKKKKKKYY